jgi:hypothetical protein
MKTTKRAILNLQAIRKGENPNYGYGTAKLVFGKPYDNWKGKVGGRNSRHGKLIKKGEY